jgi:hypothetical protein
MFGQYFWTLSIREVPRAPRRSSRHSRESLDSSVATESNGTSSHSRGGNGGRELLTPQEMLITLLPRDLRTVVLSRRVRELGANQHFKQNVKKVVQVNLRT